MEYTIIYSNNPHALTHSTHIYLYTTANCSEHGWGHIFTEYLASSKVVVAPLPKRCTAVKCLTIHYNTGGVSM